MFKWFKSKKLKQAEKDIELYRHSLDVLHHIIYEVVYKLAKYQSDGKSFGKNAIKQVIGDVIHTFEYGVDKGLKIQETAELKALKDSFITIQGVLDGLRLAKPFLKDCGFAEDVEINVVDTFFPKTKTKKTKEVL